MVPVFSWLRSNEAEQLRQIEVERRLLPLHIFVSVGLVFGIFLLFFFYPVDRALETLVVALIAWPVGLLGVSRMPHSQWPLVWLALQDLAVAVTLAFAVWWSGGLSSPALPLLVLTVMIVGARYRGGALAVLMAAVWALAAVATVAASPSAVANAPLHAISWTWVFIAAGVVNSVLAGSECSARADAVADPLLNRKALELRLEKLRGQLAHAPSPVSVVVFDLDAFKDINDTYGHHIGDAVLRDVADSLLVLLRETDLLYRLGGDEFLVLLPNTRIDDATLMAERVREAVERLRPGGHVVTASIGVAEAEGSDVDSATLVAEADAALYRAKDAGRNAVQTSAVAVCGAPPASRTASATWPDGPPTPAFARLLALGSSSRPSPRLLAPPRLRFRRRWRPRGTPGHPAGHVSLIASVLIAEAAFKSGLLVEEKVDAVDREEHREPDEQRR